MMKMNKSGRVFYDEDSETFSFPLPGDPDYHVCLDGFRSVSAVLNDVVYHLRGKHGVAGEQLLDLLCLAAAVVEPVATSGSQPEKAEVSYDAEHDCFNFPYPLDKTCWVQHSRCMTNLLNDIRHWRDSGFPDEQIVDLLICIAGVEDQERRGPGKG